jgi:hypothetical protein
VNSLLVNRVGRFVQNQSAPETKNDPPDLRAALGDVRWEGELRRPWLLLRIVSTIGSSFFRSVTPYLNADYPNLRASRLVDQGDAEVDAIQCESDGRRPHRSRPAAGS